MAKWNAATEQLIWWMTSSLRRRRNELFLRLMSPRPTDTVLDLGSEDGSQLASFYPYPQNVVIADIREEPLIRGVKKHGFRGYIVLKEDGALPVPDHSFDLVYCNSVIEHVTATDYENEQRFDRATYERQERLAGEIRRVARGYFVQTPNLHFPIEPHSMLPFGGYLSARHDAYLSRRLKNYWIKQWSGGIRLLARREVEALFPDAKVLPERFMGLVKSWIAVRPHPDREPR